jgi:hypothetical protein
MNSIEYRGVVPIAGATIEVIEVGMPCIAENKVPIFSANGTNEIDQDTYIADGTGAFRFYCSSRVDIYYNGVLSWTDILVSDTLEDKAQTGLDAIATASDRVQTAADRVQTGLDVQSTDNPLLLQKQQ